MGKFTKGYWKSVGFTLFLSLLNGPLAISAELDRASLFDDVDDSSDAASNPLGKTSEGSSSSGNGLKGYLQFEAARAYSSPDHWSKGLVRLNLENSGRWTSDIKWHTGLRLNYDSVFSFENHYPSEVAKDQRKYIELRENYIDLSAGDWDYRFGKQNVVWGEMIGLFFADVVSARDLREFILPEFDSMRIPQWAARAEYFHNDLHAEFLWVPVPSYDKIGKPGGEFYPYVPQPDGANVQYLKEKLPDRSLENTNYGIRLSTLTNGWDFSGFAYRSVDVAPTFYRDASSSASNLVYEARHNRITQYGGTVAKDFGDIVLKGEGVYTKGRDFYVTRLTDADGVVRQNTLDWAVGLDFTLPRDTRLNLQTYERVYFDHDPDLVFDRHERGYSVLLSHKMHEKLEAQALLISSFNRTDWLFRPKVTWQYDPNWRLAVGADIFHGPVDGMFGRYDSADRVYSEVRYSF